MNTMDNVVNGWEYLTDIVPGNVSDKNIQKEYMREYKIAYDKLINCLCYTSDTLNHYDNHAIYIDCNEDKDIIDPLSSYSIKFSKSKFFKTKSRKIKHDIYTYYNPKNISVRGPFELEMNIYCIYLDVIQQ